MGEINTAATLPSADDELRRTISELAKRVAELESKVVEDGAEAPSLGFSDDKLATIATSIYRSRRRRAKLFDPALLGEPAWDMLLELFISKVRGARVSTTSLCLAAAVPQATGLRWIKLLGEHGLAHRFKAPDDARLVLIEITPKGYQLMRKYIGDGATRFEMPMPD